MGVHAPGSAASNASTASSDPGATNSYSETFDLEDYNIVSPYVNISEQADAQRQAQMLQEQLHQEMGTATGVGDDHDMPPPSAPQGALGLQRNSPMSATPAGTLGTQ